MRDMIGAWVLKYVQAWTSNDPAAIGALFTEDARYFRAPFSKPWRGREAIVDGWIRNQDQPGTWDYRFEILGVEGEVGFVQGWTEYPEESKSYVNLWVIRLTPAGECTEFTEWHMTRPASAG